ncbi:36187_t:CDS:1, partial [Racocetra persica]
HTDPHNPHARHYLQPYHGMHLSTDSTRVHQHAQNIHLILSEYFNNLNQNQLKTLQPNSYDAITRETILFPQTDLNADYNAAISNQDTTSIDFIDNTPLLSHNSFLFPKDTPFLSIGYLNSFYDTMELSSRQVLFDPLNSDDYYVHNRMQLFYIDSTQGDYLVQNIHITSSEYFNNSNQHQLGAPQPNGYNAITQETIFSSKAAI